MSNPLNNTFNLSQQSINQAQLTQASLNIQVELNEHQQQMKLDHIIFWKDIQNNQKPSQNYKQFMTYKEFITRDKIDQQDKIKLQRVNYALLRKDPGSERKEYYLSIVGKEQLELYEESFTHHYKNKYNIPFRILELQLGYSDLRMLMMEQKESDKNILNLAMDVLGCLMRDNIYLKYSIVWMVCIYTFLKMFQNDEKTAYILTNFVIQKIFPENYFDYRYRNGIKNVYIRMMAKQIQKQNSEFYNFFIKEIKKNNVVEYNNEAILHHLEKTMENTIHRFFFYPKHQMKSFTRFMDYLLLYQSDLLFKMHFTVLNKIYKDLLNQMKSNIFTKVPNIQNLLFANQQIQIDCSNLDFVSLSQDIYNQNQSQNIQMKDYQQNLIECLETSFIDEFTTTYFYKNQRIQQIKRAMALMFVNKTEITEEKLKFYFNILDKSKEQILTYKQLTSLFNCSSSVSPVKEDFIQIIISLVNTTGNQVTIGEFKFILILISKIKASEKFCKLLLLFLTQQIESIYDIKYFIIIIIIIQRQIYIK